MSTCGDLISQYAFQPLVLRRFTITQHWSNGQAGFAAGWLHVDPSLGPDPSAITASWLGDAYFSYDPYGRNPSVLRVTNEPSIDLTYLAPAQWILTTELTDLDCTSVAAGQHLILSGRETPFHYGGDPASVQLPVWDVINLWSIPESVLETARHLRPIPHA